MILLSLEGFLLSSFVFFFFIYSLILVEAIKQHHISFILESKNQIWSQC